MVSKTNRYRYHIKFQKLCPLQYKRSVIERNDYRVFRSTSTWEEYDKAMKINREQWLDNSDSPSILMVQYRGNQSQTLAKNLRDITNAQIIFMMRKKKTCTLSLKSSFSSEPISKVVCRLECCGCKSIYVGQTVRNLTTRIDQ